MKAWHFLPSDRRLAYGDGREVRVGETLRYTDEKPIEMCERGLHASARIIDALSFRRGPILCRVVLSGEIIRGDDKAVATERTVLWMHDATNVLRWFAADCAERALSRVANPDPRSIAAVKAARGYVMGATTLEELRKSAADAADAADAATTAATTAAANAAAYDAAYAAAYDAAYAAAVRAAARVPDRYVVERQWQSRRLRKLIALDRRGEAPWSKR